jgi:hypothetical protein
MIGCNQAHKNVGLHINLKAAAQAQSKGIVPLQKLIFDFFIGLNG